MSIKVIPFANALTGATALFYIVLWANPDLDSSEPVGHT